MSTQNTKGNSGNTGGGTETSFTRTPQAKDDALGTASTGILNYTSTVYHLDVMANDLGGNAKSLWSVDDGSNQSGAMSGHEAGDLLTQDAPGVTGVAANRSTYGASLSITSNGRVAYDVSTIDAAIAASLTSLALGSTMTDSFIYAIRLANGTLSWAKASVTLTGVNDRPTVQAVSLSATEDGGPVTVSFNGDDVDSDDDGSTLSYTISGSPALGTLSNNGLTFTYDPGANFQTLAQGQSNVVSMSYTATDRHGATSAPAALTITVTGVNDAPTLNGAAVGITEDGAAATVDLAALGDDIDSDNDGSNLTYSLLNGPAGGSASISGTTVTVNPGAAFQTLAKGEISSFDLQVQAKDAHGATAVNTVAITVTGVNDAPTLAGAAVGLTEDGAAATIDLAALGNDIDSDNDGSNLTYTLLNGPAGGSAAISGTTLTMDPATAFQQLAIGETASFDLQVEAKDAHDAVAVNTVAVTVTGVNDAPTLAGAAVGITEDGTSVTLDLSALGADVDSDNDGSNLTYSLLNSPAGGTASISGTTLAVDPGSAFQGLAAGQTAQYTLQLQATDNHAATAASTVTVTVTGKNDAPEIQSSSDTVGALTATTPVVPFTVQQYSGYRSTVLSDLVNYAASNVASRTVTTAVIDYTDDPAGFAGEIPGSMPWPVAQAAGATGTSHPLNDNFFVRITGQVDVATADTYTFRTINDDGVYLKVNNTLIINDPGIHAEEARSGSIALTPGQYPIELFFFEYDGEASLEFSYRNSSGSYGLVDLNPLLMDTGNIQFNDVDLTDTHSVAVAPQGSPLGSLSTVLLSDTTGSGTGGQVRWNYSVDKSALTYLGAGATRVESFTVTVDDGKGGSDSRQVDITLTGINDRAVLGNAVVGLTETDAVLSTSGVLSISDADAGEAQYVPVSNQSGLYGSLSMDAAGAWTYTTNGALDYLTPGQIVSDVFTVNSVDATSTTITVNITGTVDGPTAVDDSNSLTASTVVVDNSNTVYWVDWQDVEVIGGSVFEMNNNGTVLEDKQVRVTGTITLGDGHTIGVAYEGLAWLVLLGQGQPAPELFNYNSTTSEFIEPNTSARPYTSSQVNAPTTWDIIGLNQAFTGGGLQTGNRTDYSLRTITFSEPVENLFFAVMSMNSNGYLFDQNFQIVSQGQGKYGDAPDITPTSFGNGRYGIVSGGEFHGVLKIDGSVEDLSWTSQNRETWNGFTVGTYGQSQTASASGNVLSNDVAPTLNGVIEVSTVEGQLLVGNSVTLTLASGATLRMDRDGDYFFDDKGAYTSLNAGEYVDEVFQYVVRDASGNTDTASLSIRINGINDAPVAVNDHVTVNEDNTLQLVATDLLYNDTDRDVNDNKAVVSVQGASNGAVSLNGGIISFTPAANFVGNAGFSYTMRDAAGLTSTANVNVAVTPVSDTYVISNVVSNGSFEGGLTDWTALWAGVDVVTDWQAADGSNLIDLNAFNRGGVSQTLNTVAGQSYTVGFQLSQNPGASSSVVRVVTGDIGNYQDFSFNLGSTTTNMQWANQSLSFTATGSSTVLSFNSLTPSTPKGFPDDAEGPAIDEVVVLAQRAITGFTKGANSDVLNLQGLLSSIDAPQDASAFSNGFVRFLASGADTLVQIDADGGGDDYLTAVTLIGVNLTQSDTASYQL